MSSQKSSPKKVPQLTKKHIKEIHWLNKTKKKDAIRVGKFKEFWVLSQNDPNSPLLVYDQAEWAAFVAGVKDHTFDNLVKERR